MIENIIKDIDSNIIMEIKLIPTFYGNINIFGYNFNDEQISESKMFVDNNTQEMNYSKQIS